jgi:hypothetical protein
MSQWRMVERIPVCQPEVVVTPGLVHPSRGRTVVLNSTGRTISRVSQPSESQPSGGTTWAPRQEPTQRNDRNRTVRRHGRHLAPAAILILVSGAFMAWAGYAFAGGRIGFGLWITTPPAFTIEAAFLLVRRHDRAAGHPTPTLRTRLSQESVILFAGGVMVLAGYAAGSWSWLVGAPLLVLGLPPILVAVWLGRRGHAPGGARVAKV